MSTHAARRSVRRTATNLSVHPDLVRQAKDLRLNLSEIFENALDAAIREREQQAWLSKNRDAIEGYNARVARRKVFSDVWRRF